MKKILTIAAVVGLGALASYAQGLVSISDSGSGTLISTNGAALGQGSGVLNGANASQYYFELLDSTSTTLASTANQIYGNSVNFALWTDSTLTGQNGFGISNKGKLTAPTGGANASNWAPAVSSSVFGAPDSYIVVGWSAAYGSSWSAVSAAIQQGDLAAGGYYGVSAVGINVAGGNGAGVVNLWGNQTATPGYGESTGFNLNGVVATPEPATLVLAGLGGLSLLALRRKK